jgi:hypothetical protein
MKDHKSLLASALKLTICLIVLGMFAMTLGCKTTEPKGSGFLYDYSKLQPDYMDEKGAMYWQDPGVSLKKYKKFMIDPVSFYIPPEMKSEGETVNPDVANNLTVYLGTAVAKMLKKDFRMVDKAGPDVGRLRIAITSIDVDRKGLKVYNLVPAALVLTGVGEATGIRDSIAVLSMEGEILDSLTGQRVAAVVQTKGNDVPVKSEQELSASQAYPTLDFWAGKLKGRIKAAN